MRSTTGSMNTTTKKQQFTDRIKGKPVPKDMFGNVINLGDWLVWGSGSQSASGLNFGQVVKINYNKDKWGDGAGTRVSSVTCEKMKKATMWDKRERPNEVISGFVKANRKQAVGSYAGSMVMENPPKVVTEILDTEIPE